MGKGYAKYVDWGGYTLMIRTVCHKDFPDGLTLDIHTRTTPDGTFYSTRHDNTEVEHESLEDMQTFVNEFLREQ